MSPIVAFIAGAVIANVLLFGWEMLRAASNADDALEERNQGNDE